MVADGDRCAGAGGCCTANKTLLCAAPESFDLVAAVAAPDTAASTPKTDALWKLLLRGMRDAEPVGDASTEELRLKAASPRGGEDRDDDRDDDEEYAEEDEDVGDPIELPCCRMARAVAECKPVCGIELVLARRG